MNPFESLRKAVDITDFSEIEKSKFGSERTIKLLLEMSVGCLALLVVRAARAHTFGYLFLTWNLFLAWLPFLITRFFLPHAPLAKKNPLTEKVKSMFAILAWLAFLPNAPYILTDLFHLHAGHKIPMWFDLIVILSFALTGMVLFYISFLEFEKKVYPNLPYKFVRWLRVGIFLSVGYGIYLGRFLRFNSWDILSAPGELFRGMYHSVFSYSHVKETCAITLFFALFLYFGYKLFFLLSDHKIYSQNGNNS